MNEYRRLRRGASLLATIAVIIAAFTAVAGAIPAGQVLVVEDVATGDVLLSQSVDDGSTVDIEYMHSVQQTRVLDRYTIRGQTLDNTRMEFESYGWGLPAREKVRLEDGVFVFEPDWEGEELVVKPGHVAGHTLTVDGHEYDLVELSDARAVRFSVQRQSALTVFFHTIQQ